MASGDFMDVFTRSLSARLLLRRLNGMDALDIAVCCVIVALMAQDHGKVSPDDARIYDTIAEPPQAIREAILRLVQAGLFRSGDGYLREVDRG